MTELPGKFNFSFYTPKVQDIIEKRSAFNMFHGEIYITEQSGNSFVQNKHIIWERLKKL